MLQTRKHGRRHAKGVVEVRREAIISPVRCQLRQAEEKLQIACKLLRENGFPESADDLVRHLRGIRVYKQKDGFLDWMEKPEVSA